MAKRKKRINRSLPIVGGSAEDEPTIRKDKDKVGMDTDRAFTWYDARWDIKDYRLSAQAFVDSMKRKGYTYAIKKATMDELRSIAIVGRLFMRGEYLELDRMEQVLRRLDQLRSKYIKPERKVKVSVQDRMNAIARHLGAQIDGEIDQFLTNGYRSDFLIRDFIFKNEVSGAVARKMAAFYEEMAAELQAALDGSDDQLVEGYSYMKRRELRRYYEFIKGIVEGLQLQDAKAKAVRKPRNKKTKPQSAKVAKIKPKMADDELNLVSISPQKILGAQELWVYNTEKRKLIVFKAKDIGGLSVKGMSIDDYDENQSLVKTLRRPKEFFENLDGTGKRAMAAAWKAVRAKTSSPRARINSDMILLAAN